MPLPGRSLLWGLALLPSLAAAATVKVSPLKALQQPLYYSAPATVISEDHSLLSAQITGLVKTVAVKVGDRVEEGQLLVRLDCRDYVLALQLTDHRLAALQPRISLARSQLQRARTLVERGNASEELRDQRQTEFEGLLAERAAVKVEQDNAALAVSRCEIRAPFAGLVTARPATLGSLATGGTPLVRLLRDESLEVSAEVPQAQSESLRQSPSLTYETEQRQYAVQLRTLLPLINPRTRTREARLLFLEEQALPGSSGRLRWQSPLPRVPVGLIVTRDQQLGLMLYQDGQARFHPLPEALEGQAAVVDLPADTRVIVEGQHAVQDGQTVEVRE